MHLAIMICAHTVNRYHNTLAAEMLYILTYLHLPIMICTLSASTLLLEV